jgi:hypothetical protein
MLDVQTPEDDSVKVETCCDLYRYNKTIVDTIVFILFYFVVVTDLNPYNRDTQQDVYDKSNWICTTTPPYAFMA